MRETFMVIVFDMDNTLVDEFGSSVRPGIVDLLKRLRQSGITLVLWTNSRRDRAKEILRIHDLRKYFTTCIFREDYDPAEKGIRKDIRRVKGDVLVDDDPDEIAYVKSLGKTGVLIRSFRKGSTSDILEISHIYSAIVKPKKRFRRLFL